MQADRFYHIYNRTNNNELLFKVEENYYYFLNQFEKYLFPIVEVYAYCLMGNHFHFVLKIKDENELKIFFNEKLSKVKPLESSLGAKKLEAELIERLISRQFGHFFNSYTQALNKSINRKGSLFTPNFKRKEIDTDNYLKQVILYVHLNPVLHGVMKEFENYKHSSYQSILSNKGSKIKGSKVIELFNDVENFVFVHQQRKCDNEL